MAKPKPHPRTTQMPATLRPYFIIFASLCLFATAGAADSNAAKPNIIYFLVDDMGNADTGFNGCQDIHTPNLDKLAKQGALLDSFYAQPVCSPGRAALLTGR